jgi:hypothetical protein
LWPQADAAEFPRAWAEPEVEAFAQPSPGAGFMSGFFSPSFRFCVGRALTRLADRPRETPGAEKRTAARPGRTAGRGPRGQGGTPSGDPRLLNFGDKENVPLPAPGSKLFARSDADLDASEHGLSAQSALRELSPLSCRAIPEDALASDATRNYGSHDGSSTGSSDGLSGSVCSDAFD